MAEPFLSEIRIMSFNFPPKGWALCDGQLLPINQNQALFSLLGTTFGGDGRVNFALPDYRGRVPIHRGSGLTLGIRGGEASHTLSQNEIPSHTHTVSVSSDNATADTPTASATLGVASIDLYRPLTAPTAMDAGVSGPAGGSQPHTNMQPFLTLSFCIALQGIFPSPN
ncbi:MAG: tail fiber protein [Aurantimonas endophytica]|uniref:Microcystin-dependent protein n=1 Tax=Aurantimonas endophytica TaxID=1522175 RepID=A0A7W6HCQ6_9HYPH|nr:tail fiber protein [Aurantimonas endophytica]MBB4002548.1 microcystin-dependent protein [Aurantimonas endophytica]MCO6403429.1 phage tail protein [Aurantimonas endophytica]